MGQKSAVDNRYGGWYGGSYVAGGGGEAFGFCHELGTAVFERLAGFEAGHPARRNNQRLIGLRVSPGALFGVADAESSKAAQVDLVATGHGLGEVVKHVIQELLSLSLRKLVL